MRCFSVFSLWDLSRSLQRSHISRQVFKVWERIWIDLAAGGGGRIPANPRTQGPPGVQGLPEDRRAGAVLQVVDGLRRIGPVPLECSRALIVHQTYRGSFSAASRQFFARQIHKNILFKVNLRIFRDVHVLQISYRSKYIVPNSFQMHFKCIWNALWPICILLKCIIPICIFPHMHLKCILNAYGVKCIWDFSNAFQPICI